MRLMTMRINCEKKIGEYYKIEGDVTVPQIIVDNQRIGGYDDIKKT
ncbi:MAG: hypothetical protein L6V95_06500 [Candidatus Melainabacteria bacterium]|nr:MAG: hypothetical protein L6V95_06500 [Candidatus Melainabacteria bacterium]